MPLKPRVTELPYIADATRCFETFCREPWSMLLESGADRRAGRYDIIVADPYLTLTSDGEVTEIAGRGVVERSGRQPLELLKQQLGEPRASLAGLPFAGGAAGYFAYDLGRRLEKLPSSARSDVRMPDMAIGLYDWAVVTDHRQARSWLASHGRDARAFEHWERLVERVVSPAPQQPAPFRILSPVSVDVDRAAYHDAFRRIKAHIRRGDCYQVNFSRRFSALVDGSPWTAFLRLRALNPAPFSAFFNAPGGSVLSSSPERFLRVDGRRVETKPIKGTRPRSDDPARDRALARELAGSAKDRAENIMIVDLLRNDLGKSCVPGSVTVSKLFDIESFASVHHLVSTVEGRLRADVHPLDLLAGCFPGGSITGAPKLRAMQIIEALEHARRGVYCGSLGYVGFDGNMDSSIAIRTLVHHGGRLYAWAGSGVVADSEVEAEFRETEDKAALLLAVLGEPAASLAS